MDNQAECAANCWGNDKCTYWSYYESQGACNVLSDCLEIDENYQDVISGEKRCYEFAETRDYSNALLMGGYVDGTPDPANDLMDMSGSLYACPTVTELPRAVVTPVAAVINNFPIVCGGYGEQQDG